MKNCLILISILLLIVDIRPGLAHAPHDNIQVVVTSPNYAVDQTLFCSLSHVNNFILKSTNGGETWVPSQIGFLHHKVHSIVLSPIFHIDGIAFVGTVTGDIYRTIDGGSSWENLFSTGHPIRSFAFSPAFSSDNTVFVGVVDLGVFKSNDMGASWEPCSTGLTNLHISSLVISPFFQTDQILFAGTQKGIFKSTDGGNSWTNLLENISSFNISIAISTNYEQDQTIFAGIWEKGLYISNDGGLTWQNIVSNPSTEFSITAIELSPTYHLDQTLFLATSTAGVFKSSDNGANWSIVNKGLDEQSGQTSIHYFGFSISPDFQNDNTIFLSSFEGLHKLTDYTSGWRHLNVYSRNLIRALAVSPNFPEDGTVLAGAYGGGVYRSETFGTTWQAKSTGLPITNIDSLSFSPDYAQSSTVFTGVLSDLLKSSDNGNTWQQLNVNSSDMIYPRAFALSPDFSNDQTMFIGNGQEAIYPIYKSTDGGNSFIPFELDSEYGQTFCLTTSTDFAMDNTVFVGTNNGVYRSTDGGIQWEQVGQNKVNVYSITVSPSFSIVGEVFVGTSEGVYKSSDRGDNWHMLENGMPYDVVESVAISPSYLMDQTVFVGTKSRGLYKSTDSGNSWQYVGLEGEFIRIMEVSPGFSTDQTIFIGAWNGVLRSMDSGLSWERVLNIHRWDETSDFIFYEYNWREYPSQFASGPGLQYSAVQSAIVSMQFFGDSISWIGTRAHNCGIANIYIDGVLMNTVDLYSNQVQWQQVLFSRTGLVFGPHSIEIEVSGTQNPLSSGQYINIDALEVGIPSTLQ